MDAWDFQIDLGLKVAQHACVIFSRHGRYRCSEAEAVPFNSGARGRSSQSASAYLKAFLLYRDVVCNIQHFHAHSAPTTSSHVPGTGSSGSRQKTELLLKAEEDVRKLQAIADTVRSPPVSFSPLPSCPIHPRAGATKARSAQVLQSLGLPLVFSPPR
jgi:hypothetical protein